MQYISASKVMKLKRYCLQAESGVFPSHDYFVKVTDLLSIPTIEAEPIKHGEWLVPSRISNPQCSICGGYSSIKTKFCGHCGAKMNGVSE